MKNLKIKVKLLLGFALISVLAMIVGLVGTVGLMSTDSKYRELLSDNYTAVSSLASIRENFLQQRLMIRAIILDVEDPEKLQNDINNLRSYESAMEATMASYESVIKDRNDEKAYFDAKDIYFGDYEAFREKIVEQANLGNGNGASAALAEGSKCATLFTEGLQKTTDNLHEIVARDASEMENNSMRMSVIQVIVMALSVLCGMTLGIYIANLISKPIKTMSDFFVRVGEMGDMSLSEADQKNIASQSEVRDEIGYCIHAAAAMVGRLHEINEGLSKVADGDLTNKIEALSEKDSMGLAVKKMTGNLNAIFAELRAASGQVSSGAEQIAQGAQELASGSSEQAASIENFSNALGELQGKTKNSAENSVTAAKLNEKMGTMLEESVVSMRQMLDAMKGIDESSNNITRVIKVIDDIAFQTNILALNAAVEAARAGQHGKGFAVVADEVRNLASKSAAAAKETAVLIEGSSEKVKEGNQIVDKTNTSLEAVAISSKEVMRLIGEVSSASTEQAGAIKEINQGIEQISSVVQENSASAEESAAAAEEMSTQAAALDEIVAKFKLRQKNAKPLGAGKDSSPTGIAFDPKLL